MSLTGPRRDARSGRATSLVVLLHGYGADGGDLIGLADALGPHLPDTEFAAPNAYAESDLESIRKQVSGGGWSRVVSVREKRELTEIYFWRERDANGGMVVISAEARELTVVNIVGRVDLASLGALGPMIPKLPRAMVDGKAK